MGYVRVLIRIPLFALLSSVSYVMALAGAPLVRVLGYSDDAWRSAVCRLWSRGTARIIGLEVEVQGAPPTPPFFLVSNHLSYVDVIVLGSVLKCVFVARADIVGWPGFGRLARAGSTVFIDRSNKRDIPRAIAGIERVMKRGVGVVVFPEGTSSDGSSVLAFKPGLLEAAAQARIPVSYATVTYETPRGGSARTDVCWWDTTGFASHLLRLFRLPRIRATLRFGEQTIFEADRKLLASRLWQAVVRQFRPVVQ